jgi:hypothetical protein
MPHAVLWNSGEPIEYSFDEEDDVVEVAQSLADIAGAYYLEGYSAVIVDELSYSLALRGQPLIDDAEYYRVYVNTHGEKSEFYMAIVA